MTPDQIARIAEYLALATTLRREDTPATYRRVNQLAFHLAMELPTDTWRLILKALASNKAAIPVWDVINAVRDDDPMTPDDMVWHAPRIGK